MEESEVSKEHKEFNASTAKEKIDGLLRSNENENEARSHSFKEDQKYQRKELENKSFSEDIRIRGELTNNVYDLVKNYIIAVVLITFLTGVGVLNLSDTVIVTLITTSLINIIGMLILIIKYFFNTK